jgi:hypothetical protein
MRTSNFKVSFHKKIMFFKPVLRLLQQNSQISFVILSFLILSQNAFAVKEPMKYGKVDQADIDMKVYPQDSSATAVVLCEYGYYTASQHQFVHTVRIKILKEEGKSNGNFFVPAAEKTNVRGQVLNIEDGKPTITKLGKDGIFIEEVSKGYFQARVAMPNVKVGSVIDVEFFFEGFPDEWDFQKTIPVRWSEIVIEPNQYVTFKKNFIGSLSLSEVTGDRWVAKNVPAFIPEPYINDECNYISKFDFEVESIHIPGQFYKSYATDWTSVASTINVDDDFGGKLKSFNFAFNSYEKDINAKAKSPYEKMKMAYDFMKTIKWNDKKSIWISSTGMENSIKKKLGNVADINLGLVILLRKLDIDANPVILSSRDHGVIQRYSVSLSKFNYVVAQAVIDSVPYLLDATDEYLPIGMLPERALNEKGILMKKDHFNWIDLTPTKKDKSSNYFNLKFNEDGTLKGLGSFTKSEYAAFNQRKKIKSFNSEEEYLKDMENKYPGTEIDNYKNQQLDSVENSFVEQFDIKLNNYATKVNDQYFISPVVFDKFTENPFKSETRLYPVDFGTPIDRKDVLMIELPDGYTVDHLPKNIRLVLPDKSASFQMQSMFVDNKIQIVFRLNINKPVYFQESYPDLRGFFDQLIKIESDMISVKKI